MYSDPSLIRRHTVKLSFNEREAALVEALSNYTGEEKAALLRSLILDRAVEALGHGEQSAAAMPGTRVAQGALFAA